MKLAIIHAPADKKLSAWLTQFFTGSTACRCGFVDESDGTFFDMHLLPRAELAWHELATIEISGVVRAVKQATLLPQAENAR